MAATGLKTPQCATECTIGQIASSARNINYDEIANAVSDKKVVMIGEASHGTADFYRHRAEITKRLVLLGFTTVALEADFPDTLRVNNYVKGIGNDKTAQDALSDYTRFPLWMWRNTVVEEFIEWLREHNKHTSNKCGVFGIDIYSFETSKQAVLGFINANYPHLFEKCRNAYKFNEYRRSAEKLADDVLQELLTITREGPISEELFAAISNARVVVSSAKYSVDHSWNTRDTHFFEALQHATTRYDSKAVVWAHSSHISNANYTGMKDMGELNIGSLVKQHYGDQAAAIGFSTFKGTVTCTTHWDEPAQRKNVNPGISGSLELLLHQASERMEQKNYVLYLSDYLNGDLTAEKQVTDLLGRNLLHRYIGVVYRPRTERYSHYIDTKTAKAFDIMIHVDESEAVVPLDMTREWSSFQ